MCPYCRANFVKIPRFSPCAHAKQWHQGAVLLVDLRRIKRQDTRRTSTVLFVSLNKKIKQMWVHLNCTVHWAQSTPIQASALSTQCTTNLEYSHALSTQRRLTWQALALSVTDLLGIKMQVRASCVVLALVLPAFVCGETIFWAWWIGWLLGSGSKTEKWKRQSYLTLSTQSLLCILYSSCETLCLAQPPCLCWVTFVNLELSCYWLSLSTCSTQLRLR